MKKILTLLLVMFLSAPLFAQTLQDGGQEGTIFVDVDKMPEFPGGEEAMYRFIVSNANYPSKAKENGIQGTVYLSFIVERDGSISNVSVLRSPSEMLSYEAIRVVKSMPRWKPGRKGEKNVRVRYVLPFNFQLE